MSESASEYTDMCVMCVYLLFSESIIQNIENEYFCFQRDKYFSTGLCASVSAENHNFTMLKYFERVQKNRFFFIIAFNKMN